MEKYLKEKNHLKPGILDNNDLVLVYLIKKEFVHFGTLLQS